MSESDLAKLERAERLADHGQTLAARHLLNEIDNLDDSEQANRAAELRRRVSPDIVVLIVAGLAILVGVGVALLVYT